MPHTTQQERSVLQEVFLIASHVTLQASSGAQVESNSFHPSDLVKDRLRVEISQKVTGSGKNLSIDRKTSDY